MAQRVNRIMVEVVSTYEGAAMKKATGDAIIYGNTVKSQEKHLLQLSRGAALGSGALGGLTRAVVFASTAFVGAYGLSAAIKSSTDAAKAFQSEMELVATQTGGTQREVHKMSDALLRLAPSLGQTPDALSKGLFHLESAGIRGAKALDAIKVAAKGAAIGHADFESTVNTLVGAFKSGIAGADNFGKAMATLSAIVGAGNIRMSDLQQALGTGILSAAHAFGLSFKEVGSALATLSLGSVPVVEAATRLRMSLALLGGGTSVRADKALGKIGLTSRQLAKDLRSGGFVKAIGDLRNHLEGLSKTDSVRIMQQAFGGGRFSTSIITLVQRFGALRERLGQIDKNVKRFGQSWIETQHTAEFATMRFHAALQTLQIEFGRALLPEVTKGANAVADWIDKMNRTGKLQHDMRALAHALVSVFHAFGQAAKEAAPLLQNLYGIGKSLTQVFGGLAHVIEGLAAAFIFLKLKGMAGASANAREVQKSTDAATKSVTGLGQASTAAAVGTEAAATASRNMGAASLAGATKTEAAAMATKNLGAASVAAAPSLKRTSMYEKMVASSAGAAAAAQSKLGAVQSKMTGYFATPAPQPRAIQEVAPRGQTMILEGTTRQPVEARVGGPSMPITAGPPMVAPLPMGAQGPRPPARFVAGPAETLTPQFGRLETKVQMARKAISLGMASQEAYFSKSTELMNFINTQMGPTKILPMERVQTRMAAMTKAQELGMTAGTAWSTSMAELIEFINAKLVQMTRMMGSEAAFSAALGKSGRGGGYGIPQGLTPTEKAPYSGGVPQEEPGKILLPPGAEVEQTFTSPERATKMRGLPVTSFEKFRFQLDKTGTSLKNIFSRMNEGMVRNPMGIGFGLSFLAPAAMQMAGVPHGNQFGQIAQGAGMGLIGASLLGKGAMAAPFAAVGGGLALRQAVHGPLGQFAGNALAGAGAGAAVGMALGPPGSLVGAGIGAGVGAAVGLTAALLTLRKHTESASEALERLSKVRMTSVGRLAEVRRALPEARTQRRTDIAARDQTQQSLKVAQVEEKLTRGTSAHRMAIDNLRAVESQYAQSLRTVARDTSRVNVLEERANILAGQHRNALKSQIAVFQGVAEAARNTGRSQMDSLGYFREVKTARPNLQKYIEGMQKLSKTLDKIGQHRFAKVAQQLANIAAQIHGIPDTKTIRLFLETISVGPKTPGPGRERFSQQRQLAEARNKEAAAARRKAVQQAPKPPKPHDFALPYNLQLEEAKASTEGRKKQIKAAKDELKYVRQQIKSGRLTQKGLVDAYNEEAQLQGQIASLEKQEKDKKKKKKKSKLGDLIPARFESAVEKAQAGVSTAQATGTMAEQIGAMNKLEGAYQKALKFLEAEHLHGKARIEQIKEEASLTSKIADVRKQINDLLQQSMDAQRQVMGQLGQGPIISPTSQQEKIMMGMKPPGVGRLTEDLHAQTQLYKEFNRDLQKLRRRGAPKELVKELQAQGEEALPYIQALLAASKADFKAFLKQFRARESSVKKYAVAQIKADSVVIHAQRVTEKSEGARNPRGRRGSTTRRPPEKAFGGVVGYAPDNVRGMTRNKMQQGGEVQPVPGGVYRVAEAGHPEMVIPLDPAKRERARHLMDQTINIVGRATGGTVERYFAGGMTERMSSYRDGGMISSVRNALKEKVASYHYGGSTEKISSYREGGVVSMAFGGPIDTGSETKPRRHHRVAEGLHRAAAPHGHSVARGSASGPGPSPDGSGESDSSGGGTIAETLNRSVNQLIQAINSFASVLTNILSNTGQQARQTTTKGMTAAAKASQVKSYADGGVQRPVPGGVYRVAEAGHPEMIIPLDPGKRTRAKSLVNKTMNIIGRAGGGMMGKENCYRDGGIPSFADGGVAQIPREQAEAAKPAAQRTLGNVIKAAKGMYPHGKAGFPGIKFVLNTNPDQWKNKGAYAYTTGHAGDKGTAIHFSPQATFDLSNRAEKDPTSYYRDNWRDYEPPGTNLKDIPEPDRKTKKAIRGAWKWAQFSLEYVMKTVLHELTHAFQSKFVWKAPKALAEGGAEQFSDLKMPALLRTLPAKMKPGLKYNSATMHAGGGYLGYSNEITKMIKKGLLPKDWVTRGQFDEKEKDWHAIFYLKEHESKGPLGLKGSKKKKKLRKLGMGGIVTKPTVAMIGEKGPEAVVPLKNGGMVRSYREGGMMCAPPMSYQMGGLMQPAMSYKGGGLVAPSYAMGGVVNIGRDRDRDSSPIELKIYMDGHDITNQVSIRQMRKKENSVAQVRGRHYGVTAN